MPSLQDIDEQMPKQMGRTNRGKKIYCMETEAWLQTTLSELASAAAFAKAEHETIVDDDAFPFLDINDMDDIFAEVDRIRVPGRTVYPYICAIHKQRSAVTDGVANVVIVEPTDMGVSSFLIFKLNTLGHV